GSVRHLNPSYSISPYVVPRSVKKGSYSSRVQSWSSAMQPLLNTGGGLSIESSQIHDPLESHSIADPLQGQSGSLIGGNQGN
ncbi:MAG: hypothetical protein JRN15_16655, partial [Nitrososphaerota archaeon]|nr:hypothetical protein [Nitrososphaerota archaeon]